MISSSDKLRLIHRGLADATRAVQARDFGALAAVNENVQPLIDAFMSLLNNEQVEHNMTASMLAASFRELEEEREVIRTFCNDMSAVDLADALARFRELRDAYMEIFPCPSAIHGGEGKWMCVKHNAHGCK